MRTSGLSGLFTVRRSDWTGLSLQLSWPEIIFCEHEHYIGLHTCIRVYVDCKRGEYTAGFRVLGFGMAIQYMQES